MFNKFYLYLFTKFPAHSYNGYTLWLHLTKGKGRKEEFGNKIQFSTNEIQFGTNKTQFDRNEI